MRLRLYTFNYLVLALVILGSGVPKVHPKGAMIQALRDVLDGELVVRGSRQLDRPLTLSPRQRATLELLALGLPNKEIAGQLNIAPATLREYVSDPLALFDCDNRT